MAKAIPNELKNVIDGTMQDKASGILRSAGIRNDRNTFNTAAEATTTGDTLSLGTARAGQRTMAFEIEASSNMSAASIAIGTAADPDKYLAAAALPNATVARRKVLAASAGFDAITEEEELIVTISGATIPDGTLVIERQYTQR
ncbi:MAG: hypothetical protein VX072_10895 [Pseudomonadota bacterium]|nr:hypothetical protein [Pseudomonadota bacterium]